jgi:hypothetical protein
MQAQAASAATRSAPQGASPRAGAPPPRRSYSAPISPTRGKGAKAAASDALWLTFADAALEARFARWQAASLARVDCWAVLVALLHLAFLGSPSPRALPAALSSARQMHSAWSAQCCMCRPLVRRRGSATACLHV